MLHSSRLCRCPLSHPRLSFPVGNQRTHFVTATKSTQQLPKFSNRPYYSSLSLITKIASHSQCGSFFKLPQLVICFLAPFSSVTTASFCRRRAVVEMVDVEVMSSAYTFGNLYLSFIPWRLPLQYIHTRCKYSMGSFQLSTQHRVKYSI